MRKPTNLFFFVSSGLLVASLVVRVLGVDGLAAGQFARHGKPVAHVALGKYIFESRRVFL